MSQIKLKFIEAMSAVTPVFGQLLVSGDKLTNLFAKVQGLLGIRATRAAITSSVSGGSSTTTDQDILVCTIPANYLSVGDIIQANSGGVFTKPKVSGTSLSWWVKIGTQKVWEIPVVNNNPFTNKKFDLRVRITVRAIGASGTFISNGVLNAEYSTVNMFIDNGKTVSVPTSSPVNVTIGYTFSNSNASNVVTAHAASISLE